LGWSALVRTWRANVSLGYLTLGVLVVGVALGGGLSVRVTLATADIVTDSQIADRPAIQDDQ
jgi:hypothetical protein